MGTVDPDRRSVCLSKYKNMSKQIKGILCILSAAFFFSLMSVLVRLAGDLPTMQKALFRNAVALIVSIIILLRSKEKIAVNRSNVRDLFLRAIFGTIGLICNFYAIDNMNISDANMLNKLSPFFAILMSIFILKEKAKTLDWIVVAIAFAGAMFVVKPGFSMAAIPGIVGFIGGFGAGVAYTYVRKLGISGVKGPVIVFFFSAFSTLVCIPFIIFQYQPMSWKQFMFLLFAGIAATGGQLSITAAYTFAPARDISVYDYTQVIFAAIFGFFIFAQQPDIFSVTGYVLIIGVAVFKYLYEKKKVKT